jgi:hypothetical protein
MCFGEEEGMGCRDLDGVDGGWEGERCVFALFSSSLLSSHLLIAGHSKLLARTASDATLLLSLCDEEGRDWLDKWEETNPPPNHGDDFTGMGPLPPPPVEFHEASKAGEHLSHPSRNTFSTSLLLLK